MSDESKPLRKYKKYIRSKKKKNTKIIQNI